MNGIISVLILSLRKRGETAEQACRRLAAMPSDDRVDALEKALRHKPRGDNGPAILSMIKRQAGGIDKFADEFGPAIAGLDEDKAIDIAEDLEEAYDRIADGALNKAQTYERPQLNPDVLARAKGAMAEGCVEGFGT